MKKKFINIPVIFLILMLISHKSFAQCSDAGVCQIGGHSGESESLHPLTFSVAYKIGSSGKEDNVQFHSFQLNGNFKLFEQSSIQAAIPYNIQSGPAGEINGIGDLILSFNQKLFSDENSYLDASLGVKLATGDDNKNNLPQLYQSGLGTNDFLFALNYTYDKLSFAAGYQLAGSRNNNALTRLKRGDDFLLRASYSFLLDHFMIMPQVLFIKRLAKSNVINLLSAAPVETFLDVEKSDQTQINFLMTAQYSINENYSLMFDFAVPFIKREVNIDGLTRAFSASVGIKFSLN